jgi:hypothetical protein
VNGLGDRQLVGLGDRQLVKTVLSCWT